MLFSFKLEASIFVYDVLSLVGDALPGRGSFRMTLYPGLSAVPGLTPIGRDTSLSALSAVDGRCLVFISDTVVDDGLLDEFGRDTEGLLIANKGVLDL